MSPQLIINEAPSPQDVTAKIIRRLIPFLCLLFIVNYLDRTNVAMAKLQMLKDANLTDAAYGLGAGLFFIGYFLFEVPSNLILERIGARRWIARIMITWGIISAAMLFTRGRGEFLSALRFLLGVAEAGFFPGLVLYLTYWIPDETAGESAGGVSDFNGYFRHHRQSAGGCADEAGWCCGAARVAMVVSAGRHSASAAGDCDPGFSVAAGSSARECGLVVIG